MDQQIKDLTDLNYRMLSFIETILSNEEQCLRNGKHIYMKELFIMEFDDIINKKYEKPVDTKLNIQKITNYDDFDELDIEIPISDDDQPKDNNSEIILDKMIGGSTFKKSPKVEFNTADNKIHVIGKNNSKKTNKKAQIQRRLKRIKANDVKAIGKEFNIKPATGKKYLTKESVINKISSNTRLYSKVLDHIKDNYNDVITENS